MTLAYGLISLAALLLVGVCLAVDRKRDIWLLLLFVSVFVSDFGYFLVSTSKTLEFALMANRIAYAGCVFLPFFMLMMILNLCNLKFWKWLPTLLVIIGTAVLVIAASPGFLPIYYKTVSIDTANGATRLVREYGPLHCIYSVYLFGYFATMVGVVTHAVIKKKIVNLMHVCFLVFAVLGNIVIWFIERFIPRNFEFLSVSYIFTEVFILLLYAVLQEYCLLGQGAAEVITPANAVQTVQTAEAYMSGTISSDENELFTAEQIERMLTACEEYSPLTNRERDVLRLMLENKKRGEIAEELYITESTVKKYTTQIYKKFSVSSRIELFVKLKNM